MPQVCRVCSHPQRLEIDRLLVSGKSMSEIGRTYGVSLNSLSGHRQNHLSRQLLKAQERKEIMTAESLLSQVEGMLGTVDDVIDRADDKEWLSTVLAGIGEKRNILAFVVKLMLTMKEAMNQDQQVDRRLDIDKVKGNLSREEMKTLLALMSKAQTGQGDVQTTPTIRRRQFIENIEPSPVSVCTVDEEIKEPWNGVPEESERLHSPYDELRQGPKPERLNSHLASTPRRQIHSEHVQRRESDIPRRPMPGRSFDEFTDAVLTGRARISGG